MTKQLYVNGVLTTPENEVETYEYDAYIDGEPVSDQHLLFQVRCAGWESIEMMLEEKK